MIEHVQDSGNYRASAASFPVNFPALPRPDNWLIGYIAGYYSTTITLGVSGGGVTTWSTWQAQQTSGFHATSLIVAGQVTAAPSETVTFTQSPPWDGGQMQISEFEGVGAGDSSTTSLTSSTPGAIAPVAYGELFMSCCADPNNDITAGPGAGWTLMGTVGHGGLGAYQIQASGSKTTLNPSFTVLEGNATSAQVAFSSRGSMLEVIAR
jgi:hypothetical protein